jgi:hypothetical protein
MIIFELLQDIMKYLFSFFVLLHLEQAIPKVLQEFQSQAWKLDNIFHKFFTILIYQILHK